MNETAKKVKSRPIIMNAEMVRAILDGQKVQTRRPVSPQPDDKGLSKMVDGPWIDTNEREYKCPFGAVGDRLWVQETWGIAQSCFDPRSCTVKYLAEGNLSTIQGETGIKYTNKNLSFAWCRSVHMPRWASRILLEISDVRVERVQDISEEDIVHEGIVKSIGGMWCGAPHKAHGFPRQHNTARIAFEDIWNHTYAKRGLGWEENPWVWVITFRRVE